MNQAAIFHLTIPINDIERAKQFYAVGLGCQVGRENKQAVIFNFYGSQLVAHMTREPLAKQKGIYPRHLGLILPKLEDWQEIADRAGEHQLTFYEEPKLRFLGKLTQHQTFFLEDPFYNLLEFKYYYHSEAIFAGRELTEIGDRGNQ
jgi:uncharacterized protein